MARISLVTAQGTDLEKTFSAVSFASTNPSETDRAALLDLLAEIRRALADPSVNRDAYYRVPVLNAEAETLRILRERFPRRANGGQKPHRGVENRRQAEEAVAAPTTAEAVKAVISRFEAAAKLQNVGGMEAALRQIRTAKMPLVILALHALGKDAQGMAWFLDSADKRVQGAKAAQAKRQAKPRHKTRTTQPQVKNGQKNKKGKGASKR